MRDDKSSKILKADIKNRLSSDMWDLAIAKSVISARKTQTRKMMTRAAIIPLFLVTAGVLVFLKSPHSGSFSTYDDLISRQINGTYASVFPEANTSNGNTAPLSEIDQLVDNALSKR